MLVNKKRFLIIVLCIIVLCGFFFVFIKVKNKINFLENKVTEKEIAVMDEKSKLSALEDETKAVMSESGKDEILIDFKSEILKSKILTISGSTKRNSIVFYMDYHYEKKIPVKGGKFSIDIDISNLENGWHTISVRDSGDESVFDAVHLNKLKDLPAYCVSNRDVTKARIKRDQTYISRYQDWLKDEYHTNDRYFGTNAGFQESNEGKFDDNKIPMVLYNEKEWRYNPITVSQHALSFYNKDISKGSPEYNEFIRVAKWLGENQSSDGSFRSDFEFNLKPYYTLPSGFASGMAQGELLSVYARAYMLTKDKFFLEKGEKCLEFMLKDSTSFGGGCKVKLKDFTDNSPLLKKYEDLYLFDEYIKKPQSYILNGNLFAVIGLYDWWQAVGDTGSGALAHEAFNSACKAIEVILPYYDYRHHSAYDLLQYSYNTEAHFDSSYAHDYHIVLLKTLYDITGNVKFKEYSDLFINYSKGQ